MARKVVVPGGPSNTSVFFGKFQVGTTVPICLAQIVRMMCMCDVLLNPKYTGHVYKVTVAVDNLGNVVWICDLMPGKSADVTIWDQRGPSRMHGQFFDYEVGLQWLQLHSGTLQH